MIDATPTIPTAVVATVLTIVVAVFTHLVYRWDVRIL